VLLLISGLVYINKQRKQISELENSLQKTGPSQVSVAPRSSRHFSTSVGDAAKNISGKRDASTRDQARFYIEPSPEGEEESYQRILEQLQNSVGHIDRVYAPLFENLDLSDEEQQKFTRQIIEMEELRAVATETLRDLEFRRASYDQEINEALSPNEYKAYLDVELGRGARVVVSEMQSATDELGVSSLSQEQLATVEGHLKEIGGGADYIGSFGPYGKLPTIAVGTRRIKEQLDDRMSRLEGEKTFLLESINDAATTEFVEKFYDSRILVAQEQLREAQNLTEKLSSQ